MTKLKDSEKTAILISLVLTLLLAFYVDKRNVIKEAFDSLQTNHQESISIEYGDSFNALNYIDKKDNLEIIGEVDNKKVGTHDLKYLLKAITKRYNVEVEREYDSVVEIKDTKKPIIEIEKEEVNVYLNSEYDLNKEYVIYTKNNT